MVASRPICFFLYSQHLCALPVPIPHPLPHGPACLQESYGCEPQKAAVEPMLGWDHLWYPFTCLSVPFPLIGQSR